MGRVLVYYAKYPQYREILEQRAHSDSPPDAALICRNEWRAILNGEPIPEPQRNLRPPASDAEADPSNDRGCGCDPEPEMYE